MRVRLPFVGSAICVLALAVLAAPVVGQEAFPEGTKLATQVPTGDTLNMREWANAKSSIVVALPHNTIGLIATGRSHKNEADAWIEVQYDGKTGWVHSRFVRASEARPALSPVEATLTALTDETTDARLELPLGILTKRSRTKFGQNWSSPDDALSVDTLAFPKTDTLRGVYDRLRTKTKRVLSRSELKGDSFSLEGKDGGTISFRVEVQQKEDRIRGLSVAYSAGRQDEFRPLTDKVFANFSAFKNQTVEAQQSAPVAKPTLEKGAIGSQANADEECDSPDSGRRLAGCTALLTRGDLAPAVRAVAYSRRADSHLQDQNYDGAIADLAEAAKLDPKDEPYRQRLATAFYLRGLSQSKQGHFDGALADYTKAIEANAKLDAAFDARVRTYIDKGDIDQAIEDLANAVRFDSTDKVKARSLAELSKRRATERLKRGDHAGAIDDYTQAIDVIDDDTMLFLARANLFLIKDDARAALDADKALTLSPGHLQAYEIRGHARMLTKDYIGAVDDFSFVIKQSKKPNATIYLARAQAYEHVWNFDAALTDYQWVLKVEPRNASVKEAYKRLQKLKKELKD